MEENSRRWSSPGFRFHPTEEELVHFYLRSIILHGHNPRYHIIRFLDIYSHDTLPSSQDVVLCKICKKATSLKVLEQRADLEEAIMVSNQSSSS
ncbi:hypothetical protein MLD38_023090 [Melastoma candidum]|uniref:Uncharacterized protein n=1 Tax=Melastoma candidum TaxID=119954 RepID=A0ACB9QPG4_9MYRT|nr:hypothetical protein MLD38_023090 [Melastoma candidum]